MEIKQMAERLNSVPVRKKAKRLLAVTLAVMMVNPITGFGVAASAQESEIITAFAELSGEVASQQLAVGAEESDIYLPDKLDVTIGASSADTTDETSAGDSTVSGNDAAEQQDEANNAEDATATDSNATPVVDSGAAPAVETTKPDSAETAQTATLKNITWKIDADNSSSSTFDSSENGAYYTYVPVLPEGYTVADGVSLPEISVLIGSARMRTALGATEISIGDTVTIDGINYTYQGDVSEAGLDLSTAPTEATYYKAGDGYALFTPANGGTPATLVLHSATISSAAYDTLRLGAETVLKLEDTNRLTNTRTKNGVGIDNYSDGWQDTVIQGGSGDSLIVSAWTGIFAGNLTISGGNVTANGSAYGIITTGDMLIENGAQVSAARDADGYALNVGNSDYGTPYNLTISGASSLTISGEANLTGSLSIGSGATVTVQEDSIFWADCTTAITNNGTIVNNGIFRLPYSYTAEQVNALNIPGTIQLYSSELDKYKIYANGGFYADGGDVSTTGLDLSDAPVEATYYKAGDGYALFTPAGGGTPATLALTNATIEAGADSAITLPETAVTIELSGKNTLRSTGEFGILGLVNCSPTITSSNGGTLDIEAKAYALNFEKSNGNPLTIGGNASVTAVSHQAPAVIAGGNLTVESGARFVAKGVGVDVMVDGTFQALNFSGSVMKADQTVTPATFDFTIYGTCEMPTIMASLPIGTSQYGIASLHIPSGAQMTIPTDGLLTITDMENLKLEGKIVNNGRIVLPAGTTVSQIKAMNLTGTGSVSVSNGQTYTNDGVVLKVIGAEGSGLDLTTGDHSGKTVANDGYSWDSSSKALTLGNALINGDVTLPAAATINTTASTVIQGRIMGESGAALNLVFDGTAPLNIGGNISGGSNGDTITAQNGAQVTVSGSIFLGASGGTDGTLNVTGSGTKLTVSSANGYAVMCDTVNVQNGAALIANGESMGVEALTGVNVTGGSTLTTNCDYGVYIIGGKLTVDDSSKLITNAAVAPFCIVDTTSAKTQSDVLSLSGVPTGTEIAAATGTFGKYWSLVSTAGSLTVSNESNTPVTLTGAVQGQKLDFSKPLPNTYSVNVQNDGNGTASAAPASAKQGTEITLTAAPKDGYKFKEWQVISGGVTITNNKFTMPDGEVTVKAIFESTSGNNDNGGGNNNNGGGNDNGGNNNTGGNTSTAITSEKKPDQPVIGSVNATGKTADSHATITITDSMAKAAIEKAQSAAKEQGKTTNGIGVEVLVSAPGAKSFTIITERAALNRLVSTNVKVFQITGLPVRFYFDQNAVKQQQTQGTGDTTMVIKSATVKDVRSAYDMTLSTLKDGKTVNIANFGNGSVTISLPYTLGKGEAVGGLYAVSVDAKGNATRIAGSAYDANSGSVIFTTNQFSKYGIGYTAPSAKFTDISSHWAKESIDYVVGRGLLSGTSDTAFSPNTAMTRGMLVTALGRLAGVDTKAYTTSSFTDVKTDSVYRPYIEWADSKGMIQGIGNSQFAPDRAVTREEIAVIFANYAKATGYTLPVTREATTFADAASIGSTYKDAVKAMQQAGIMMGGNNNNFNPGSSATRAEVASMLTRYIKLTIDPATAQGWAKNDSGQWMYFKDGKAVTGWQTIGGKVYCFDSSGGAFASGWKQNAKGEWFFLSSDGSAVTGWKDIGASGNTKRYYFDTYGVMIAGKWLEIDGKWYYFYSDGSLARSTKIDGYEVDTDGVRKTK